MQHEPRDQVWSNLDKEWDLIIIGGGITGAGVLCEASRRGLKSLLVEANDFAAGTSSRSSKLVHGGMRYLKNFQLKVTRESVSEREFLLKQAKGLVNGLDMYFVSQRGDRIPAWTMGMGLILYSLLANRWQYHRYNRNEMLSLCPYMDSPSLTGGFPYFDAQTDDARLTLRVIQESIANGGTALNYTRAVDVMRKRDGRVCGVAVRDESVDGKARSAELRSKLVINATGAWGDQLRQKLDLKPRLRPLQGSHLAFPHRRLPLEKAVNIFHPRDGRPVFIFPWEGVTIAGTTDVDVRERISIDPHINLHEVEYLLEFVQRTFPGQEISERDVISTCSGIRPVINTGKADPSRESREHAIWLEDGLLTITGGKLTTFRVMAHEALKVARKELHMEKSNLRVCPVFDPIDKEFFEQLNESFLPETDALRLIGRYGLNSLGILNNPGSADLERIAGTSYHWAELKWSAGHEDVHHLDDLLLRRIRIGLLLPDGAAHYMKRIKEITQSELGWDDTRWKTEEQQYHKLWKDSYSPIL